MKLVSLRRFLKNQNGSAVVETSLAISVTILILTGGLSALYFSFARVWLSRSGYEGLICLSTTAAASQCEQRLKDDAANALPMGNLANVHVSKSSRRAEVHMEFRFADKAIFSLRDSIDLPLKTGKTHWGIP